MNAKKLDKANVQASLTEVDWQLLAIAYQSHLGTATKVNESAPGLREFLAPFAKATSENGHGLAKKIKARQQDQNGVR